MFNSLITELSKKIGNNLYNFFSEKVIDISSEIKVQDKDFFNEFSENYLEKFKSVYYVKTLINAEKGRYLYDIYVPMNLNHQGIVIDQNIIEVEKISKKALISGVGGIGKSLSLKKLFLDTIINQDDLNWKIPIFIELRNLLIPIDSVQDENFFEKYILSFFVERNLSLEPKSLILLLNTGKITFLLDGLDEVRSKDIKILKLSLDKFIKKYNKNTYVISSRPRNSFLSWSDFAEFKICPLDKQSAVKLIETSYRESDLSKRFIKALHEDLFERFEEIAEIPLLLLIMYLTYNYNGSIPHTTSEFYAKAFSTMYNTHDLSKDESFERERKTKLSQADFEMVFESMCFFSYFNEVYSFDEYELKEYISRGIDSLKKNNRVVDVSYEDYAYDVINILCFLVKENGDYRFIHRSFQEYYAAEFIRKFPDEKQTSFLSKFFGKDYEMESDFLFFLKEIDRERFIHNFIYAMLKEIIENFNSYDVMEYRNYIEDNIVDFYVNSSEYYFYKYNENKARDEFYDILKEKPSYEKISDLSLQSISDEDIDIPNIGITSDEIINEFITKIVKKDIMLFQDWVNEYERELKNDEFSDFEDYLNTL